MSRIAVYCSATSVLLLLLLCTPKRESTTESVAGTDTTITYSLYIAPMLAAHCSICHIGRTSGGVEFGSYDKVVSFIDKIIVRTKSGSMPPQGSGMTPLTASQVDTLQIWKASGVRP